MFFHSYQIICVLTTPANPGGALQLADIPGRTQIIRMAWKGGDISRRIAFETGITYSRRSRGERYEQ